MYIENINGPADVKKLNIAQMTVLASEMRDALLTKLSRHGGHFGPNFGMVEATIALHYVFESPKDKFVFDVSHQSYPHKMLTGRKDAFLYEEHYDDVSGYSSPHESEHDHFTIGHTSTSVSLACGLAKGRDLKGDGGNVVAIIGDGSAAAKHWKRSTMRQNWTATSSSLSMTMICPSLRIMAVCIRTCACCARRAARQNAICSARWVWITAL